MLGILDGRDRWRQRSGRCLAARGAEMLQVYVHLNTAAHHRDCEKARRVCLKKSLSWRTFLEEKVVFLSPSRFPSLFCCVCASYLSRPRPSSCVVADASRGRQTDLQISLSLSFRNRSPSREACLFFLSFSPCISLLILSRPVVFEDFTSLSVFPIEEKTRPYRLRGESCHCPANISLSLSLAFSSCG